MAKTFTLKLKTQNSTRLNAWVTVTPGMSITLGEVISTHSAEVPIPHLRERTFQVGDKAEYDSYNLSYFGPIKSITKKNVIIKDTSGKNRRLPHAAFHWRNINFDIAKKSAENSDTMRYI
tara:strand:- start:2829 stop:3188 length:360 start_codon:yes stop_codon:yes gene_type:complete